MIIGHIGARKGSKGGLREKNFRPIAGKPLFAWSLDQLLRNKNIDKVIVSTDDEEIYHYALDKGTVDIGLRPAEIAMIQPLNGMYGSTHSLKLKNRLGL